MEHVKEKRRSPRKVYKCSIRFEKLSIELKQAKTIRRSASGVDISNGGLGLTSKTALKRSEVVKLYIPLTSGSAVPVFAEVRWILPFKNHYRAGLRFL